jgi:hypothetical protein
MSRTGPQESDALMQSEKIIHREEGWLRCKQRSQKSYPQKKGVVTL